VGGKNADPASAIDVVVADFIFLPTSNRQNGKVSFRSALSHIRSDFAAHHYPFLPFSRNFFIEPIVDFL
jgi:hypothetical protein